MRRGFVVLASALLVAGAHAAVEPETVTITNSRNYAAETLTNITVWSGAPVTFTNCLVMSGTSTVQNLTNVVLTVAVGLGARVSVSTGHVDSVTDGLWSASSTVPVGIPGDRVDVQVRLADTNGIVFYYPLKTFTLGTPLSP
jgi:hypothetical protein